LLTYHGWVFGGTFVEEYSYYVNTVTRSNTVIFLTEGISFAFFNISYDCLAKHEENKECNDSRVYLAAVLECFIKAHKKALTNCTAQ